jgi:hypothetical protein
MSLEEELVDNLAPVPWVEHWIPKPGDIVKAVGGSADSFGLIVSTHDDVDGFTRYRLALVLWSLHGLTASQQAVRNIANGIRVEYDADVMRILMEAP